MRPLRQAPPLPHRPRGGVAAWLLAVALLGGLTTARPAAAAVSEPEGRADDAFDLMNLLAKARLHDIHRETWNLYGQFTWISSFKLPFRAPYTNVNGSSNSLTPEFEHSFTGTVSLYLGLALWKGAELYWVPEAISERPLSNLAGLGGAIQNFELQKQGTAEPTFYNSRLYLRQTIDLGGTDVVKTSDPMQLGAVVKSRRLVLIVGNFSVLDFLDKNTYSGDLRRQFFNMAFLTYGAYDFAADARGYAWGGIAELYLDDWTVRFAHLTPPKRPNQLAVDFRFWEVYGDQVELEHTHSIRGLPGSVRLLGYRNHEVMGRFDEAVAAHRADPTLNAAACGARTDYGSTNAGAPDLCWVRRPQEKYGIGINLEQAVAADIGVFLRAMFSDGQTEVYSFTSTDMSLSLGVLARGALWRRPRDVSGVGFGAGFISDAHATYLRLGGIDGFVGDGRLNQAPEMVAEAFYAVSLWSSGWLALDYQLIANPGFNADRGPLHILGARFHAEF